MKSNAYGCEFLSIWYIYQSNYNVERIDFAMAGVVSSFQFGIFIKVITTERLSLIKEIEL
ncbi:hypothetical protein EGI88_14115 [Empedobacter falsenii]|uniref:hypothetical protein n=1 Tax=Empedobacter falsenii TaxID=343874 RepID=UPI000F6634D5|nr:hypothetical protein [Empedobacter falsenii]RRT86621.1 hypothetical protein EGI88_14115 [Empedobacter falsenii]